MIVARLADKSIKTFITTVFHIFKKLGNIKHIEIVKR